MATDHTPTGYLFYGNAGSPARAARMAENEGVYWTREFGDIVVAEPLGLVRLMQGGCARQDPDGLQVVPEDGEPFVLYPLCRMG
ncbi:hypothetical protein F4561_002220 [Lipingzhangella halophila]|uniref:Uncharacterized protein n=1 Tax=Lipingzhangella halophila TaxID=1783352 RepID=A0A7W7RGD7_9ACTN|nr:hypothetical protein [Lipingzhangella halophila]MBB4931400.1 hypothetical protein [Lipingzhangella halophila]